MSATTSIIAIVILIVVFVLVRQMSGDAKPPAKAKAKAKVNVKPQRAVTASTDTQFHAVSLKFDSKACEAAKAMGGKRFLSSAAPRIPLLECDTLGCQCHFIHYKDRRSKSDRRSAFRGSMNAGTGKYEQEQRENKDRRKELQDEF